MQSLTGGSVARRLVSAALAVKRARVVVLVAAALGVSLMAAGPAAADKRGGVIWGSFYFTSYGDYMTVHDQQADGYAVTAEATDGRNWWYCANTNGYAGPEKTCNWDVPENTWLRVY